MSYQKEKNSIYNGENEKFCFHGLIYLTLWITITNFKQVCLDFLSNSFKWHKYCEQYLKLEKGRNITYCLQKNT